MAVCRSATPFQTRKPLSPPTSKHHLGVEVQICRNSWKQEWRYPTSLSRAEYFAETVALRPRVQVDSDCLRWLYIICLDDLYFDGGKTQQSEGEGMCAVHHRDKYSAGISGGQNRKRGRFLIWPSSPASSLARSQTHGCATFSDRLSIRQT